MFRIGRGITILALISSCLILAASAMDKDKVDVSNSGVVASDPSGSTFTGSKADTKVDGDFDVAGSAGKVNANSDSAFSNFDAVGPNGQSETGSVDQGAFKSDWKADNGDHVDANSEAGGKHSEAIINGGDRFNVERPSDDEAVVSDPQSGKTFTITGIQKQDILIKGAGNPYQAKFTKDQTGAINTRLKEKQFGEVGPAYDSNLYPPDTKTGGSVKLGVNPLDTGAKTNPLKSISPQVTVSVNKITPQPCPESTPVVYPGEAYADVFGDNGFQVIDNTINVELPPVKEEGGVKSYEFPGCFVVHATIQIPPNIDVANVGGQAQVFVAQAGNLVCDPSKECSSAAQNKPAGGCFYCDLCNADKSSKAGQVFGNSANMDWNVCQAKAGAQLPLSWKVCPDDASSSNPLQAALNFNGDIQATIKIFLKKSGSKPSYCTGFLAGLYPQCKQPDVSSAWNLVGCKKAVISYKVSTGSASLGSSDVSGLGGLFGRRRR